MARGREDGDFAPELTIDVRLRYSSERLLQFVLALIVELGQAESVPVTRAGNLADPEGARSSPSAPFVTLGYT